MSRHDSLDWPYKVRARGPGGGPLFPRAADRCPLVCPHSCYDPLLVTEQPTTGLLQSGQSVGFSDARVADAAVDPREAILEVKNLRTSFPTAGGFVHAVDNVSFNVRKGEALALVGESG